MKSIFSPGRLIHLSMSFVVIVLLAGCKTDNPTPSTPKTLYIVGTLDGPYFPGWWKDFSPMKGEGSESPGNETVVTCAYVDGIDVYHGGYRMGVMGQPIYWKNGVLTVIPATTRSAVYGIFVVGGKIHCVGTSTDSNGATSPKYWVNGVPVNLPFVTSGRAARVYVSGTDVYIIGNDNGGAVVWKNGVRTLLDAETKEAWGLAVSGNDVYAVGHVKGDPVFWKNGQRTAVSRSPGSTVVGSQVVGIHVKGEDVYMVGRQQFQSPAATYWRNNSPVILDQTNSAASALFVDDDNNVHVVGLDNIANGFNPPAYWKNGVMSKLTVTGQTGYGLYIGYH